MATEIIAGNATNSGGSFSPDNTGILAIKTGSGSGTTAVTVDASQNVGIGTGSNTPQARLEVLQDNATAYDPTDDSGQRLGTATVCVTNNNSTANSFSQIVLDSGGTNQSIARIVAIRTASSTNDLAFVVEQSNTKREGMRLDGAGALLVGTTVNTENYKVNIQFEGSGDNGLLVKNTAATGAPALFWINDSAQSNNNNESSAIYSDSTTTRWQFRKNGGLANYSANNVNLSDERLKTDIKPAGDYLAKICAIPVKTFLYKDQTDTDLNLGVIAQDVEAVAPELVDTSGFGETPEDGVPYKTIYQTDLQYALMKCIQEQQAMIEELKAKVAALEAK